SNVSCQARPFSARLDLGLAGSFTTRGGGSIAGAVHAEGEAPAATGVSAEDFGLSAGRRRESRIPSARERTPYESWVTKSTPTGMSAARMIHVPTGPRVRRSASDPPQPTMPPLSIRSVASVSDVRARIPVMLVTRSASPAQAGQPVAIRGLRNADMPYRAS